MSIDFSLSECPLHPVLQKKEEPEQVHAGQYGTQQQQVGVLDSDAPPRVIRVGHLLVNLFDNAERKDH
jgi:hypothetical protein